MNRANKKGGVMKLITLITVLIVGLTATYGFADMDDYMRGQGMMGSGQGMMEGQSQQKRSGRGYSPCEQMMGYDYMRGMMGRGHMGGYGMMGPGHMSGMMGMERMGDMRGMGRTGDMMGGYGYRGSDPEAYQKFMDDTVGLRKKLHNKMFEYKEARRDPDATRKSLLKIEKEMMDLKWKIYEMAPEE